VRAQLRKPDPMVVATKLLARRKFTDTGKQFNMIAASWIQFMIHDWVDHLEDTNQVNFLYIYIYIYMCVYNLFI
jgi:alpha-dioxygenase